MVLKKSIFYDALSLYHISFVLSIIRFHSSRKYISATQRMLLIQNFRVLHSWCPFLPPQNITHDDLTFIMNLLAVITGSNSCQEEVEENLFSPLSLKKKNETSQIFLLSRFYCTFLSSLSCLSCNGKNISTGCYKLHNKVLTQHLMLLRC